MDINKKTITQDEIFMLIDAASEIARYGKTSIVCPRCGGKILVDEAGSSYRAYCENEDISTVSRGI